MASFTQSQNTRDHQRYHKLKQTSLSFLSLHNEPLQICKYVCLDKRTKYKDLYGNKRTLNRNLHRWQNWPMNWKWANRPKSAQETHTIPRNNLLGEVNLFRFYSKLVQIFRLRARTLIPIYTISKKSLYFAHCET